VLGEGETRMAALLADHRARADLPAAEMISRIRLCPPLSGISQIATLG
jgi:hypothetical protein